MGKGEGNVEKMMNSELGERERRKIKEENVFCQTAAAGSGFGQKGEVLRRPRHHCQVS